MRIAAGVVGGFTGGELGVKQFVQEGSVKLADEPRGTQSPLVIAGGVAIAATLGGLFIFRVCPHDVLSVASLQAVPVRFNPLLPCT